MKNNILKKSWKDITLALFNEILDYLNDPDDFTILNILGIVYPEIDFEELTLPEFAKFKGTLDFINNEIPRNKIKKHYVINGKKYDSNFDISAISVSQFIDYQNFVKKLPINYADIISVFFTPEGHKYNDGYDLILVRQDLENLTMPDVMGIIFFLVILYRGLLEIIPYYLKEELKKIKPDLKTEDLIKLQTAIDLMAKLTI